MQPADAGVLQVEPTDHCNLSCRMCAPHAQAWDTVHGVPKGQLDPGLWARAVDGMVDDGVIFDHVILQWLGEPTLHPRLPRILADARRLSPGYVRIDTNGVRLDEAMVEGLLQVLSVPGPPLLVVLSVDAATAATYARVKGRDHLPLVLRNARRLVRRRRQRGAPINIQAQFVVQQDNAPEARAFLDWWADLFACQGGPDWHDEVMFKRLSVGGGAQGQAAADDLYEQTLRRAGIKAGRHGGAHVSVWERRSWQQDDAHVGARTACPALWLTPVIRHDGHLVMCCADLASKTDLGSLADASFTELWQGERATRRRLAHLSGRFEGPCASCGGVNWYDLTPQMAEQARQRGRALGL